MYMINEPDVIPGNIAPVTLDCITNTPVYSGVLAGASVNSAVCAP